MQNKPLVSVVILNFNGEKFLRKFFSSIYNQTYPHIEWILVDNASTDGSVEFIQENFPRVRIVRNRKNLGVPGGNNQGIKVARGRYILLLPNDVKVDKHCVEELVDFMEKNPRAGMATCKVVYMKDPTLINSTGTLLMKDFFTLNRGIGEKDEGQYDKAEEVFGTYTAAIYRREVFEEGGLFDEDYFIQRDEDDISMRARFLGWECYYVPRARVEHIRSPSSGGVGSLSKLYFGERNRLWNVIKYLPWDMVILSFGDTLKRYLYMGKLMRKPPHPSLKKIRENTSLLSILLTLLKVHLDTLLHLHVLLHKRKKVSSLRKIPLHRIRKFFKMFPVPLENIEKLYYLPEE